MTTLRRAAAGLLLFLWFASACPVAAWAGTHGPYLIAQVAETAGMFERLGLPAAVIVALLAGFAWRERAFNGYCERQETRMDKKDAECKIERVEQASGFTSALGTHTATLANLVRQLERRDLL